MDRNSKKLLIICTALFIPAFTFASPGWFKINGISPCWPVIWLLPFSLKNGLLRSAIAATFLGFLMDSFTIDEVSYVPSLFFLSLLWGRYGKRNNNIELFFNIGLMAIFGTAFVGFSIWAQKIFLYEVLRNNWFHSWSIHVLLSEVIITGLLAPLFSSWLLLTYKKS